MCGISHTKKTLLCPDVKPFIYLLVLTINMKLISMKKMRLYEEFSLFYFTTSTNLDRNVYFRFYFDFFHTDTNIIETFAGSPLWDEGHRVGPVLWISVNCERREDNVHSLWHVDVTEVCVLNTFSLEPGNTVVKKDGLEFPRQRTT